MRPNVRDGSADSVRAKRVDDTGNGGFVHTPVSAIKYHNGQVIEDRLRNILSHRTIADVTDAQNPYADIAERLRWHRDEITGLTQKDYAEKIGTKRPAYSQWEAGLQRLSLNGALSLRRTYGLSLDFLYEGIDDALPMTLRNAWRDRPSVRS